MSTFVRFCIACFLGIAGLPVHAGEPTPDSVWRTPRVLAFHSRPEDSLKSWRTFVHKVGLDNNGTTPFVILSREGKKIEIRPSLAVSRCGAGTWEQLMNTLAIDPNRTVRMRTALCGDDVQIFLDTNEKRDDAMPATDGFGFSGTVSWK